MSNRYEEAPPEFATAKALVWWDIKSCPVPEGYDTRLVRRSIESVLSKRGYCGPLTITAFGYLEDIPDEVLRTYSSTGIIMKHDPLVESSCTESQQVSFSSIIEEVHNWIFLNQPPATIVFISNPKCVRLFRYQMMCLPTDEYNILLAYESEPDFAPANLLWETLLEDAKIGNTIEEAFTGEPGGIFCAGCDVHCSGGTRIEGEDLSAHIRSENHGYEMFSKSGKGLFDVDYNFAYKWGTYYKIVPEKLTYLLKNHPERKGLEGYDPVDDHALYECEYEPEASCSDEDEDDEEEDEDKTTEK